MPLGIDNGVGDTSGRWTCAVALTLLVSRARHSRH